MNVSVGIQQQMLTFQRRRATLIEDVETAAVVDITDNATHGAVGVIKTVLETADNLIFVIYYFAHISLVTV